MAGSWIRQERPIENLIEDSRVHRHSPSLGRGQESSRDAKHPAERSSLFYVLEGLLVLSQTR